MHHYQTKADCKCGYELTVAFRAGPSFKFHKIPMICKNCGSNIEVQCKPALFRKQVQTRVKLIKHTQKLLDIRGIKE